MKIINGDSLEVLKSMESNSLEALVTDPPYGLSKMTTENIQECLTNWLNGEKYTHKEKGFMNKAWDSFVPSPDLWKEVFRVLKPGAHGLVFAGSRTQDLMSMSLRLAGFEVRDTLMWVYSSGFPKSHNVSLSVQKKEPSNTEWEGWGTALKPAYEPIILVRKPPVGSIAQNVLDHGVGGINIDANRVSFGDESINFEAVSRQQSEPSPGWSGHVAQVGTTIQTYKEKGRFPANVMIDEHIEHEAMKRYFFCSKASKKEREAGLLHLDSKRANTHPTVKPIDLMRYLVKMIVPPSGTALDPFCGSGSTMCALALEDRNGIGIELQEEYCEIAQARVKHWGGEAERIEQPNKELEELPLFKGLL